MSEDTFTIKQIRSAMSAIEDSGWCDGDNFEELVIAELTKTAWTPKVGCAYAHRWHKVDSWHFGQHKWKTSSEASQDCEYRPITAAEIGLEPFVHDERTGKGELTGAYIDGWNEATDEHNEQLFPGDTE